jgi:hypothetical protein
LQAKAELKINTLCQQIGTDNSAANINAILAQSGYTPKEYYDDAWEAYDSGVFPAKLKRMFPYILVYLIFLYIQIYSGAIFPMLCQNHQKKNLKEDVYKCYPDPETAKIICGVVGYLFDLETNTEIKKYLSNLMVFIASPRKNAAFVRNKYF